MEVLLMKQPGLVIKRGESVTSKFIFSRSLSLVVCANQEFLCVGW